MLLEWFLTATLSWIMWSIHSNHIEGYMYILIAEREAVLSVYHLYIRYTSDTLYHFPCTQDHNNIFIIVFLKIICYTKDLPTVFALFIRSSDKISQISIFFYFFTASWEKTPENKEKSSIKMKMVNHNQYMFC